MTGEEHTMGFVTADCGLHSIIRFINMYVCTCVCVNTQILNGLWQGVFGSIFHFIIPLIMCFSFSMSISLIKLVNYVQQNLKNDHYESFTVKDF